MISFLTLYRYTLHTSALGLEVEVERGLEITIEIDALFVYSSGIRRPLGITTLPSVGRETSLPALPPPPVLRALYSFSVFFLLVACLSLSALFTRS